MKKFDKPALSVDGQLALLRQRGLKVRDEARATRYLEVISFFRLSPYMRPFQDTNCENHTFHPGSEFKQIVNLYAFDRELRLFVMDALERVEVATRAAINNHMAVQYNNSHWFMDQQVFNHLYQHRKLLNELKKKLDDEKRNLSREAAFIERKTADETLKQQKIEHRARDNYFRFYAHCYNDPALPPGWAIVETLSLGALSRLFGGLKKDNDRKKIAKQFDIPHEILESWLHTLTFVRNLCAHHSRLWNRELPIPPKLPKSWQLPPRLVPSQVQPVRRVYVVLLMLSHLMEQVSPDSEWRIRFRKLLKDHPETNLTMMGFPSDWEQHPLWKIAGSSHA
jgi:abortive infection bacteriophage resistance protein